MKVNIHEAKTQLLRLVEKRQPVRKSWLLRLESRWQSFLLLERRHEPRSLGMLKGKLHVPKSSDAPLPRAMLDDFEK
jgi:hypothetical protein